MTELLHTAHSFAVQTALLCTVQHENFFLQIKITTIIDQRLEGKHGHQERNLWKMVFLDQFLRTNH